MWPILLAQLTDRGAAHRSPTLSREVLLLNGTMKLLVAQPDPGVLAHKEAMPPRNMWFVGWRDRDQVWHQPDAFDNSGCGLTFLRNASTVYKPCLFDISADPRETTDLSAAQPELVKQMWAELNTCVVSAAVCVCVAAH